MGDDAVDATHEAVLRALARSPLRRHPDADDIGWAVTAAVVRALEIGSAETNVDVVCTKAIEGARDRIRERAGDQSSARALAASGAARALGVL